MPQAERNGRPAPREHQRVPLPEEDGEVLGGAARDGEVQPRLAAEGEAGEPVGARRDPGHPRRRRVLHRCPQGHCGGSLRLRLLQRWDGTRCVQGEDSGTDGRGEKIQD